MQFVAIPWQSDLYQQEITLRDEVLRKPLGLAFTTEQLVQEKNELRFGVVHGGRLIACLLITPLSPSLAKLRQMAVESSQRGNGVGAFLIEKVESALVELGFDRIELNARDVAVGFYEKLGYEKEGEEFIEVNIPHYKMSKPIG
ncbi:MAG: GNAT family N-acetyltransferase [Pirellulaceae bacterium]|nr:GNAT family N-acetyltransferase [Pirellulaceae bacterium]